MGGLQDSWHGAKHQATELFCSGFWTTTPDLFTFFTCLGRLGLENARRRSLGIPSHTSHCSFHGDTSVTHIYVIFPENNTNKTHPSAQNQFLPTDPVPTPDPKRMKRIPPPLRARSRRSPPPASGTPPPAGRLSGGMEGGGRWGWMSSGPCDQMVP